MVSVAFFLFSSSAAASAVVAHSSSAKTALSSSVSLSNISSGCATAIQTVNSTAASACPDLHRIFTFTSPTTAGGMINLPEFKNYIQNVCVNDGCVEQLNSFIAVLTTGACSGDSLQEIHENGVTTTVPMSTIGWYSAIGGAVLCTKTSDLKGYCGITEADTLAPILATSALTSLDSHSSSICTDCLKNEIANAIAVPNLPLTFKQQLQAYSDQANTMCGGQFIAVAGTGPVPPQAPSISFEEPSVIMAIVAVCIVFCLSLIYYCRVRSSPQPIMLL